MISKENGKKLIAKVDGVALKPPPPDDTLLVLDSVFVKIIFSQKTCQGLTKRS